MATILNVRGIVGSRFTKDKMTKGGPKVSQSIRLHMEKSEADKIQMVVKEMQKFDRTILSKVHPIKQEFCKLIKFPADKYPYQANIEGTLGVAKYYNSAKKEIDFAGINTGDEIVIQFTISMGEGDGKKYASLYTVKAAILKTGVYAWTNLDPEELVESDSEFDKVFDALKAEESIEPSLEDGSVDL